MSSRVELFGGAEENINKIPLIPSPFKNVAEAQSNSWEILEKIYDSQSAVKENINKLSQTVHAYAAQKAPDAIPVVVNSAFGFYRNRGYKGKIAIAAGTIATIYAASDLIKYSVNTVANYTIVPLANYTVVPIYNTITDTITDTTDTISNTTDTISNSISSISDTISNTTTNINDGIVSVQETIKETTDAAIGGFRDLILLGLIGVCIYTLSNNSGGSAKRHGDIYINNV